MHQATSFPKGHSAWVHLMEEARAHLLHAILWVSSFAGRAGIPFAIYVDKGKAIVIREGTEVS